MADDSPDLSHCYLAMTPESLNALGLSQARQSRFAEAAAAFQQAISANPNYVEAHYNFAKSLKDAGKLDESLAAFRRALQLRPDAPALWHNLANLLYETQQLDPAIDAYRRAITLDPSDAGAHAMLARVLHQLNRPEESIAHFQTLTRFLPTNAETHHALGVALHDLNRLDEAAEAYRRSLALDPAHAHAAHALSLIHLAQGDFPTGWQGYEARRRLPMPRPVRDYPQPSWDGSPLNGKRILLHAEQGLGDTIQFIRYAPMVTNMGGHTILQCPSTLRRLLLDSQLAIAGIHEDGAPLPSFDLHCPLLSLPGILHTTLDTIPASIPYIFPDAARVAHWVARLRSANSGLSLPPSPPLSPPCLLGLAWAGSLTHRNDRNRSISAESFEFLTRIENVALVSLQKSGSPPGNALENALLDFTSELTDLAETAALIANLDLVITVDTVIAHLAGALGKPTWLLLPYAADWRWLLNRSDSPWYPTVRLFRQPCPNDWSTPLNEIAIALQKT